jgi:putative holliday junction resolvase
VTRLLGVDLGRSRVGLAVGDSLTGSIQPLPTIRRGDDDRDSDVIGRLVVEQGVSELVVGLPRNMDGSEGPQAAETRAWGDAIAARLSIGVCYRDERLTSERAEVRLGRPRRGRSGGPPSAAARAAYRAAVDREAAAAIVQAELDARAGHPAVAAS